MASLSTPAINKSPMKVSLFGEVLLDCFSDCNKLGGAPYNVACHLKGLGAEPLLVSRVGTDENAEIIMEAMKERGLGNQGIQQDPAHPTGIVRIQQDEDGHRFDIPEKQAFDYIHPGMTHLACLEQPAAISYFGTLAQRNIQSRTALDVFLQDSHCKHFLDLNLREPWVSRHLIDRSLKRAQIVKMSAEELKQTGKLLGMGHASVQAAAMALIKDYALDSLIVTEGSDGAWMAEAGHRIHHVSGLPINEMLVDTIGAGDAFSAMCIIGIVSGWSPLDMLEKANEFAAGICTLRGAVPEELSFYAPYCEESLLWR